MEKETYAEFKTGLKGKTKVVCSWEHRSGPESFVHKIIPDGCVDIVMIDDSDPIVFGPNSRASLVTVPKNTMIIGVRLFPGAAARTLRENIQNIVDKAIPLEEFWGSQARKLHSEILSKNSLNEKRSLLLERIQTQAIGCDPIIHDCLIKFSFQKTIRIDDLSRDQRTSPRQLYRKFCEQVGYGPKVLIRVLRLQQALENLERFPLSKVAYISGYTDQSHMNREFMNLSGMTPSSARFRRPTINLSDLFKT